MKTTCLSVMLIALFSMPSFCQKTPKTSTVVSERTIKLNGGARAFFGGGYGAASRTYIPVSLPANTVEWHYSLTTGKDGQTQSENLNLASQLTNLLTTAVSSAAIFTGIARELLTRIKTPSGAMPVNAAVSDYNNAILFVDKKPCSFYPGTEMLRVTQGEQQVKAPVTGTWYLCLQNISSTAPVWIKVEVVAITLQ